MSWAIVGGLLGSLVGAGGSIAGGQAASNRIPDRHDQAVAGFDPRADPLLSLLNAFSSAGLGFAPDPNLIQASSPVNRLENSLLNSLGRVSDGRDLREMNMAISSVLGEIRGAIDSGTVDPAAIEDMVENAFMEFRGPRGEAFFGAAQQAIASGGDVAATMAAQLYPDANPNALARKTAEIQTALDAGAAEGLSGDALARYLTNEVQQGERGGMQAGLFRTALSSAGFDDIGDLLEQELAFRERAGDTTSRLGDLADSRFGARESANLTIDRLLRDYPAYGASDIDREIQNALQPIHAMELEQANALGYNPATNLALTRQSGIRDALSILSGRQGLTNTSLMALRNELGQQTGEALATSGQTGAAMANAANLASQQALALNQLGMQGSMFQGESLGSGLAGAGNSLSMGALLAMLGGQSQPGTQNYSYTRRNPDGSTTGGGSDTF
jgi:hypothetical protein